MEEYILFSPIGKTDPTRDNYDGAFLHILRHYRPKKAYIYMTKEICEYDDIDNRYEIMTSKLLPDCNIEKIKNYEIDRPNNFEYFHRPFKNEIDRIRRENPESRIIVNVSSGTPQMKSSLYLICALEKARLIPVQVSTPANKGNTSPPVGREYDIEGEWETLLDNEEGMADRCERVNVQNAWAIVGKEIIQDHIKTYDYSAAAAVAKGVRHFFGDRAYNLLKAGESKLEFDFKNARIYSENARYEIFPVKAQRERAVFEYIMYLSVKAKREEYADFTRAVSPVISDLFELYLEKVCSVNISAFCKETGKGKKLLRNKLPSDVLSAYDDYFKPEGFRDSDLSGSSLLPFIICKEGLDSEAAKKAIKIRKFESAVRNVAAHEITEVSEMWLEKKSGMKPVGMLNSLKWFFEKVFPGKSGEDLWSSYNRLNKEVEKELSMYK